MLLTFAILNAAATHRFAEDLVRLLEEQAFTIFGLDVFLAQAFRDAIREWRRSGVTQPRSLVIVGGLLR